jgi:hypothetical protein
MDARQRDELGTPIDHPPVYTRMEARYFGLTPHLLAGSLGAFCLVAGLVLLGTGPTAVGLLLLVAAALLTALFLEQARRRRESRADEFAAAVADRLRDDARVATTSVRVWTHTGRRVARLRLEMRRLRSTREHAQYELGGAAYEQDESRTHELRRRLRELELGIEARDREVRTALEHARRRTKQERRAAAVTEVRRPD